MIRFVEYIINNNQKSLFTELNVCLYLQMLRVRLVRFRRVGMGDEDQRLHINADAHTANGGDTTVAASELQEKEYVKHNKNSNITTVIDVIESLCCLK